MNALFKTGNIFLLWKYGDDNYVSLSKTIIIGWKIFMEFSSARRATTLRVGYNFSYQDVSPWKKTQAAMSKIQDENEE